MLALGPDVKNSRKLCLTISALSAGEGLLLLLLELSFSGGRLPEGYFQFTMAKTQVNLIILSPTPEVNNLTFSSISTATTIGELRERIFTAAPSHPAPGRQRLIYRGHALIDAKKTLKDVFTQDIVCLQHRRILTKLTKSR